MINISGTVPAEAQNGMTDIEDEWMGDRTPDPIVAVVIIDRHGFKFVDAKQERAATMKFRHIEPILDVKAAAEARALLETACAARGGSIGTADTELDIPDDDLED